MAKNNSSRSNCPITNSLAARTTAEKSIAKIRKSFPKGVAAPALRALYAAELFTLESLSNVRESDLAKLHGMGPKAIAILKTALDEKGLSFME